MLWVQPEAAGLQRHVPGVKMVVLIPSDGFGSDGERELIRRMAKREETPTMTTLRRN
jgi:hypothetical protein